MFPMYWMMYQVSERNLVSGNNWENYFKNQYGAENVQWKPVSLEDIISSPERLYKSTENGIKSILVLEWNSNTN